MTDLKVFFNFFKKSLREMPEWPKIKIQEPVIKWLTAEEQDKVFAYLKPADLPIFSFLRAYGTRLNEARALQWGDVFLQTPVPYVVLHSVLGRRGDLRHTTKTKVVKVLPIIPETAWIFANPKAEGFVFNVKGRPYSNKMLHERWNVANKASGVKMVCLYQSMRHSFGCQRLNDGFGLDQIAAVMGHTNTKMTQRYAKYLPERLAPVIRGGNVTVMPVSETKLLENKGIPQEGEKGKNLNPFDHRRFF